MRAFGSTVFAAAALAAILAAGCGTPEDETLLRFLGFQAAGDSGTGSVSLIEGDVQDGTSLKVDASFQNQTFALDATGGGTGAITIHRVAIDYAMADLDPPSFSFPVSLYVPPASGKDATAGETVVLSDIPVVPVSVKQWLIDHDASGDGEVIEMTANVEFLARTDAGEDLNVSGALAVTLKDEGGGGGGGEAVVTIEATIPTAVDASPGVDGQFRVYRTGDRTGSLNVSYQVSNENGAVPGATCAAGIDYEQLSGTVPIAAGSASSTIPLKVCVDTVSEQPERVRVTLASGTGYAIGQPNSAIVTIRDSN